MATTVPGGYYLGTDGKPHDAEGRPLPVRAEPKPEAEQAPAAEQTPESAPATKEPKK